MPMSTALSPVPWGDIQPRPRATPSPAKLALHPSCSASSGQVMSSSTTQ
ncbi:hypothetical protein ACN28S_17690 [Cystobacter fuscus]